MTRYGYIYALFDPFNGEIRYVGKTILDLDKRLREHIKEATLGVDTHKCKWIRKVLRLASKPLIGTLVMARRAKLNSAERSCIALLREAGAKLTNGTDGGDGGRVCLAARRKIGLAFKGRKFSQERRKTQRELALKMWKDNSFREKMHHSQLRRWADPEKRAVTTNAIRKACATSQHKEALRNAWTEEKKEAARQRGFARAEKMRVLAVARWADPQTRAKIMRGMRINGDKMIERNLIQRSVRGLSDS